MAGKKIEKISLKQPLRYYQPRLTRFLTLLLRVRGLKPANMHLWRVMDSTAFQDTETALEVALYNASPKKAFKNANDEK